MCCASVVLLPRMCSSTQEQFPATLQKVYILPPSSFLQKKFADSGLKFLKDDVKFKVPLLYISSHCRSGFVVCYEKSCLLLAGRNYTAVVYSNSFSAPLKTLCSVIISLLLLLSIRACCCCEQLCRECTNPEIKCKK